MTAADAIARVLGGCKAGHGWIARCPAHDDRDPSLSICCAKDGKLLVRCHAGCPQDQVITALGSRGLWPDASPRRHAFHGRRQHAAQTERPDCDGARRTGIALALWRRTRSAAGTPVEAYLRSRGLHLPIPPALRFHPGLKHPAGGLWPAMVALITRGSDDTPLGIHRTFLARDGSAKAPLDRPKMMLGPSRGGAVRLSAPGELLMVGEGIETCLAAMQATGHPAWAALSTSGLRTLDLPDTARNVIVLADGDEPGEAAARDCAWRWKREGRRVRIARPPKGTDFNDLLMGRVPSIKEDAR